MSKPSTIKEKPKIKAKVKVYWSDDSHWEELIMKVKFKLPNRKLKTTAYRTLASSFWINKRYKNHSEFLSDCIEQLKDVGCLKLKAKDVVKNKINKLSQLETNGDKEKYIQSILKYRKSFEIEVDI